MTYLVNHINRQKPEIVVENNDFNTQTDLVFAGKSVSNYSISFAENFLHLLENFANDTPPSKPVEGELWYDTSTSEKQLKIFNGTIWVPSGGLYKSVNKPTDALQGDLWIDLINQQLYLFTGFEWILVGPQFSAGTKTGILPEVIKDINNVDQIILTSYVRNKRVMILSSATFQPKATLEGFTTINEGCTLHSTYNRFYGIAEKAEALLLNGVKIPVSMVLRSDVINTVEAKFNVKTNQGLTIGAESQIKILINEQNNPVIFSSEGLLFGTSDYTNSSVIRITSDKKVGINTNSPSEVLEVNGNVKIDEKLYVVDETDSLTVNNGCAVFNGGIAVKKSLSLGGDLRILGTSKFGDLIPDEDNKYYLGSPALTWKNVYALRFDGTFYGTLIGNVNGNVSGSSGKLYALTEFKLSGDITNTNEVLFDGQTGGFTKEFVTELSEDFISSKQETTSVSVVDEFLVYQPTATIPRLKKVKKQNLLSSVPQVQLGMIFPFAGSRVPTGYLLCDGSEILIVQYQDLFNIIGYVYSDNLLGKNTFKVPDLRGRSIFGLDNMNNNITVPSIAPPYHNITTVGARANRLENGDDLGNNGGIEELTLGIDNLPEHEHTLKSRSGVQFFAHRNISSQIIDENVLSSNGMNMTNTGQYISSSGGVLYDTSIGQPVGIMPPYLCMNYIIFSG